jgi:hypothetical protein
MSLVHSIEIDYFSEYWCEDNMKTAYEDNKTIAKLRLRLSFGSCILLMGLGCMAGTATVAQPLRVSQQPAAANATAAAAQAAYDEGERLHQQGNAKFLTQAIAKLKEAAPLFAAVGDRKNQATCFLGIGYIVGVHFNFEVFTNTVIT